jgi:hypothetical protein
VEDALVVDVKEVRIQDRLQNPRQNDHDLRSLPHVPLVNPVEDVKGAVETETEEVVRGDCFGLASLLQLEHLGKDGDRLEKD